LPNSRPPAVSLVREPHQIGGGSSEGKGPSDVITATEPGLLLPGDRLDPAECLLDALADALADGITVVLTWPPCAPHANVLAVLTVFGFELRFC
jgi:hypothetical protein